MAAPKSTAPKRPAVGHAGGARHALHMLRRLERSSALCDACAPEPEYRRRGAPQRNPVLEYLQSVMATGDARALAGFCSVLSGYIGTAADGSLPDSDYLARYVEQQAKADTARDDAGFVRFLQFVVPPVSES